MGRSFFYITAGSREEAEKIAAVLVENNLVACANVLGGVQSFFQWEGEVKKEEELLVVGKTRTDLVGELVEKVKEVHSYDVPCVISWPITHGNSEFLHWIDRETQK